jgi:formate hydrogenlyase subunit 3/multisubunit Na+/H+ antiporter MnhD subunit
LIVIMLIFISKTFALKTVAESTSHHAITWVLAALLTAIALFTPLAHYVGWRLVVTHIDSPKNITSLSIRPRKARRLT